MKKSKKILSVVLAVLMAMSCITGLTIFNASAAEEEQIIYFEVPTLESWGTTKVVFCHLYAVYGDSEMVTPAWGTRAERCTLDEATGKYYFDVSKQGGLKDNADYALLFATRDSNQIEHQTGNVTVGKECYGDTVYVTGDMIENTEDSSKMDYKATWRNPENAEKYGPKAAITSTGKIVGEKFPVYQPKEEIVSQFIHSWAVTNADLITPEIVQEDCATIGVEPKAVYDYYAKTYETELADPENYPGTASLETVETLLGLGSDVPTDPNPTVPTAIYGDVNGDGQITVEDATLVQKATVLLVTFDENTSTIADVNEDGFVDILDVTLIQKHIVKLNYNTGLVGQPV